MLNDHMHIGIRGSHPITNFFDIQNNNSYFNKESKDRMIVDFATKQLLAINWELKNVNEECKGGSRLKENKRSHNTAFSLYKD